jgi:hypothetical protein
LLIGRPPLNQRKFFYFLRFNFLIEIFSIELLCNFCISKWKIDRCAIAPPHLGSDSLLLESQIRREGDASGGDNGRARGDATGASQRPKDAGGRGLTEIGEEGHARG